MIRCRKNENTDRRKTTRSKILSGASINSLWLELPYLEQISWSKMFLSCKSKLSTQSFCQKPFQTVKGYILSTKDQVQSEVARASMVNTVT